MDVHELLLKVQNGEMDLNTAEEYLFAGSGIYLSTASFFVSDRIKESERRLSISCCI